MILLGVLIILIRFLWMEEVPCVSVHRCVVWLSIVALRKLCWHLLVLLLSLVLITLCSAFVSVKHWHSILDLVALLVQLLTAQWPSQVPKRPIKIGHALSWSKCSKTPQ